MTSSPQDKFPLPKKNEDSTRGNQNFFEQTRILDPAESSDRGDDATIHFKKIGDYEIVAELGKGGMGVVYKAYQKSLKRHVALKVLPPGLALNKAAIQRFEREARASADLHHPNIVPVHDIGHDGDTYYFTMEYIEGKTFDELIHKKNISIREGLEIIIQVAKALYYAHSRGLLHRDVKPGNIMLDSQERVLLMDFGLSRPQESVELTQEGSVLGTPAYMAPEQAQGKVVDERADLYSLGAVLYEILTKQRPFKEENIADLLKKVIEDDPLSPRSLNPDVSRDLETICLKALEKERYSRFASVKDFYQDIERFLNGEPILASPTSAVSKVFKKIKKHKSLSVSITIILLLSFGFGSYFISQQLIERARWQLIYADDFQDAKIGNNWSGLLEIGTLARYSSIDVHTKDSPWKIINNQLTCSYGAKTILTNNNILSGNLKINFDITLYDSLKTTLGILFLGDNQPGSSLLSTGYLFEYGNVYTALSKEGVQLRFKVNQHARIGGKTSITIEKTGYDLLIKANGKRLFKIKDFDPLADDFKHDKMALVSYEGKLGIDNLRVYTLTVPLKTSPLVIGDKFYERGHYTDAIEEYENIRESYPGKRVALLALYKIGMCKERLGIFAEALQYYDDFIKHAPHHELLDLATIRKGICAYKNGAINHADSIFSHYVRNNKNPELVGEIAHFYRRQADGYTSFENILACIRKSLHYFKSSAQRDNCVRIMTDISNYYCDRRDFDQAEAILDSAAREYPFQRYELAEGFYWLSLNCKLFGEYERAIKNLLRIISDYDDQRQIRAAAMYDLGEIYYLKLNVPEKGVAYYKKILDEIPEHAEYTLLKLAEISYEHKKYKEAESYNKKLLSDFPGRRYSCAQALFNLGKLYYDYNKPDNAEDYLYTVLTKYKSQVRICVDVHLFRADQSLKHGDVMAALKEYKQVIRDYGEVGSLNLKKIIQDRTKEIIKSTKSHTTVKTYMDEIHTLLKDTKSI